MKPLLLTVLVFIISLGLPVLASAEELVISLTPTPTPQQEIVYDLPYPGLLPDSPLYIFKTARDILVGFLIADPVKKASFDLLQSDKRFAAGIMLYQKKPDKKKLAFDTISKGHNYLEDAIGKVSQAQQQSTLTSDLPGKIDLSIRKQQQMLQQLLATHPDAKSEIDQTLSRLAGLQTKVEQIIATEKKNAH